MEHEIKIPSGDILAEDELLVTYDHEPAEPSTGSREMIDILTVLWRGRDITSALTEKEKSEIMLILDEDCRTRREAKGMLDEIRDSFLDQQEAYMREYVQNLPNS